jgi:hypothetical protein
VTEDQRLNHCANLIKHAINFASVSKSALGFLVIREA